jgi:hypothetical protein
MFWILVLPTLLYWQLSYWIVDRICSLQNMNLYYALGLCLCGLDFQISLLAATNILHSKTEEILKPN